MNNDFLSLTLENIETEHLCCAISDKKCKEGYQNKRLWLKERINKGFGFTKLNERAKVFVEYGSSEHAWFPVEAENAMFVYCFWVSGRYKKQGYAKRLIAEVEKEAIAQGRDMFVTVAGVNKFHFMSDPKWLLLQGWRCVEETVDGFGLFVKKISPEAKKPKFCDSIVNSDKVSKKGLTVAYSSRCPFTNYYVETELRKTADIRGLSLQIVKLQSQQDAYSSPSPLPNTIFTLFIDGQFITTDVSICLDSRFDKMVSKLVNR